MTIPHHERIQDETFRRALDLLDSGDVEGLRSHLRAHPGLVHERISFEGENYFCNPALLEFVAENPIRRGKLPSNIVEVARVILDAGAKRDQPAINETLGLVCSGRIARECGVQIPLIDLLCEYGADPNAGIEPALPHGEFEAAKALLRKGAWLGLAVAAALGRVEDARGLIATASTEERRRALALAAQFGNTEMVRLLLDAGEDPNRYNPAGTQAHSTPLHQAALGGHRDVVKLLVERGARLDLRDTIWQGTPEDWAVHAGDMQMTEYLRSKKGPAMAGRIGEHGGLQPILCAHLLRKVDEKLIELLSALAPGEWDLQTLAPLWKVRDVAAHLLDTALRKLSVVRDGCYVDAVEIRSSEDLITIVNRLNREGVTAYRRLSPRVLIDLVQEVSEQSAEFHESLDPFAPAAFNVSWAGEQTSLNWFDTARELTERWHHQQQIRLATNRPGIMTPELYHPVLDCFARGLPHLYRDVEAPLGAAVLLEISGECGGAWVLVKELEGWRLSPASYGEFTSRVTIPQDLAWRVFTKGVDRACAREQIEIVGNRRLGEKALELTSIVG